MGGKFGRLNAAQTEQIRFSWGTIRLPPIVKKKQIEMDALKRRCELYETFKYHILWQPECKKSIRYVIDVDSWVKDGYAVFPG